MYSYGPPHMAVQKQDDQLELTYSNYVRTQDVTLKTCRRRWMIGRSGERGSEISVLAARHDDDDDDNRFLLARFVRLVYVGWILTANYYSSFTSQHFDLTSCIWLSPKYICPVGWGSRKHRLHLCSQEIPPHYECPVYDTKQSDGEVPVILDLWGMRSIPSLPSLPGPLWPGVVAPDKGPIYGLNRTWPCFLHYTDFCI